MLNHSCPAGISVFNVANLYLEWSTASWWDVSVYILESVSDKVEDVELHDSFDSVRQEPWLYSYLLVVGRIKV